MGAISWGLRSLNALVARAAGLAGGLTLFGAWRLRSENPEALVPVFGTAEQADYALIGLGVLSLVFLVPFLTRIFFHGGPRWRAFRGAAQIVLLAGLVVLIGMTLEAVLPGETYAAREPLLMIAAQVLMGVAVLSWLGRETGLAPGEVPEGAEGQFAERELRSLRKMRSGQRW